MVYFFFSTWLNTLHMSITCLDQIHAPFPSLQFLSYVPTTSPNSTCNISLFLSYTHTHTPHHTHKHNHTNTTHKTHITHAHTTLMHMQTYTHHTHSSTCYFHQMCFRMKEVPGLSGETLRGCLYNVLGCAELGKEASCP